MKHAQGRAPAGTGEIRGERNTDKSTTPQPSFQQLVAEAERSTLWLYRVRDLAGELVMVSTEPLTRAEAEHSIKLHFGERLIALRPGVGA